MNRIKTSSAVRIQLSGLNNTDVRQPCTIQTKDVPFSVAAPGFLRERAYISGGLLEAFLHFDSSSPTRGRITTPGKCK